MTRDGRRQLSHRNGNIALSKITEGERDTNVIFRDRAKKNAGRILWNPSGVFPSQGKIELTTIDYCAGVAALAEAVDADFGTLK